jgi:hypothetical protein
MPGAQRLLDRHVRHQRAHHAGHRLALGQAVGGHHVEQFVAVVEPALGVDHLQPVGVAVQRDAVVGAVLGHGPPAPAATVAPKPWLMFSPSGCTADGHHHRAQFVEDVGRHVVGRAMRGVDDDLHAAQRQVCGTVLLQNSM